MVVIPIEVLDFTKLVQKVEDGDLDHLNTLAEGLTKAARLCEGASRLCFSGCGVLSLRWLVPLDELDFQYDTVAIVDIGEAVSAADWKALVDASEIAVVGRGNVQKALQVLCVDLVLNLLSWCFFTSRGVFRLAAAHLRLKLGHNFTEDAVKSFLEVTHTSLMTTVVMHDVHDGCIGQTDLLMAICRLEGINSGHSLGTSIGCLVALELLLEGVLLL